MKNSIKLIAFLCLFFVAFTTFAQPANLTVTSISFKNDGKMPLKCSCEGAGTSPALSVRGIPAGTKSLALTAHDPDAPEAGGVTHWVAWNLPVSGNIPAHFLGGTQGLNTANKNGYKAVCPPTGTHHYNFKVYALDTKLQLDKKTTNKSGLEIAILGHILAQGQLTGLYEKHKK